MSTYSGWYPDSFVRIPFSGIEPGFKLYSYHVGDIYAEVSGIERTIGLNPLNGYDTVSARISGIESGYVKTLTFTGGGENIFGTKVNGVQNYRGISGISGVVVQTIENDIIISGIPSAGGTFTGGAITSDITPTDSGTLGIGTRDKPFATGVFNQYATTLFTTTVIGAAIDTNTTINWDNGSAQILDYRLSDSGTNNVLFSNGLAGSFYTLNVIASNSGYADIYWSGLNTWLWRGGIVGTLTATSGTQDVFSFFYNGTKYLGNSGKGYA